MFSIGLLGASGSDSGCTTAGIICAVAGVIGFSFWNARRINDRRANTFRWLAARGNNRVQGGGAWSWPVLHLTVDGVPGEVTYRDGRGRNRWTRVRFQWPFQGQLRVTPQGFTKRLRSQFIGTDIEVGSPPFDAGFWVEASSPKWAREVLTHEIRAGLLNLRHEPVWAGSNKVEVTLDLGPAGVSVKVARLLVDDRARVENFIELAVLILRAARGTEEVSALCLSRWKPRRAPSARCAATPWTAG